MSLEENTPPKIVKWPVFVGGSADGHLVPDFSGKSHPYVPIAARDSPTSYRDELYYREELAMTGSGLLVEVWIGPSTNKLEASAKVWEAMVDAGVSKAHLEGRPL